MSFRVPDKTTINKKEFKPEKYVIAFAPELITFILENMKLTTYRFGDKYNYLQVGDRVSIQNSSTQMIVGHAKITHKYKSTFQNLPLNKGTHESYDDKAHQRNILSGYYAYLGRPIADEDEFLVFDFVLLP